MVDFLIEHDIWALLITDDRLPCVSGLRDARIVTLMVRVRDRGSITQLGGAQPSMDHWRLIEVELILPTTISLYCVFITRRHRHYLLLISYTRDRNSVPDSSWMTQLAYRPSCDRRILQNR